MSHRTFGLVLVATSACGTVSTNYDADPVDARHADATIEADALPAVDSSPADADNIDSTVADAADLTAMVAVPAGVFWMGCNVTSDPCADPNELPIHEVTLGDFLIDATEVTEAAYGECAAASVCAIPLISDGPENPVRGVTWAQAQTYCEWRGKRLPTEAEWEKAARGTDARRYPWDSGAISCDFANYTSCQSPVDHAVAVGQYPDGVSPYGAYDMAGNAAEWVHDWYSATYYEESPDADPKGPVTGTERVVRGGSATSSSPYLRTAARTSREPGVASNDVGFRCAKDD